MLSVLRDPIMYRLTVDKRFCGDCRLMMYRLYRYTLNPKPTGYRAWGFGVVV